jgi:hypothetical protein
LQRYCNEFDYRYNNRKEAGKDRFEIAVRKVSDARITYNNLIGKDLIDYRTGEWLGATLPTPPTGYEHLDDLDPDTIPPYNK